ncbi:MAG: SOS response-associated peptidase [Proteobacteria bacterium]|nr:SOS response-associated peptidase [Pseudomonadota bacterium]
MCGRFANVEKLEKLAAYYNATPFKGEEWQGDYNIAPTDSIPVVVDEPEGREIRRMRWGLVPFWAKDIKIGTSMINARAETIKDKPGFRDSFKGKRCIIPATGFYEWKKLTTAKEPYYFSPDEGIFSFAGLWSSWISPESIEIETCTIITTDANSIVKPIHNRMPVILGHNSIGAWLSNTTKEKELMELLIPLPDRQVKYRAVSKFVNSVKNDGAQCIEAANE